MFQTLDHYNEGFIHADNLQEFFRKHYVFLEPSEIYAIVRRLDTDGDARIRYHELEEFFAAFACHNVLEMPDQKARRSTGNRAHDAYLEKVRANMFATPSKLETSMMDPHSMPPKTVNLIRGRSF